MENRHNCHLLKYDLEAINTFNYIKKKLLIKLGKNNENSLNPEENKSIHQNNIDISQNDENEVIVVKIKNDDSIEEDFYLKLFSIILNNFNEYPTYENLLNILAISNYIIYYYDKHKEIKLFYIFDKDKIKNNKLELFSDIFVNNNRKNLFLVINDNIIELETSINLKDIFDDNFLKNNSSLTLKLKLIQKFNKRVTDFSFMFYKMSFSNLSWDISNFDTINIDNMSYMF